MCLFWKLTGDIVSPQVKLIGICIVCLSPYPLPPCHSLLSNDLLIFMIISCWVYSSRTFLLEYNHEKFFFITLNPLFFPVSFRYHLLQYIFCNEIISICKMVMQQLGSFSNNLTKKKKNKQQCPALNKYHRYQIHGCISLIVLLRIPCSCDFFLIWKEEKAYFYFCNIPLYSVEKIHGTKM